MKNINRHIKTAAILTVLIVTVSCKKSFLELTPKGRLIAKTTNDYNLLLSNLDYLNVSVDGHIPMSDEVAAIEPYFTGSALRTQRLFRWDDVIYEPNEDASEMKVPMQNIYSYNTIINEVLDATEGTEQLKKSLQAEALAGRAWTYFLLINLYGKPYNPASAATDPGFPLVTKSDVTASEFTRASVKEVYDFIVNDLTTAILNLPPVTTHRLRMSRAAGEALLGKVYMFMGKFSEALPLFNASLNDIATATTPVRLYDYNVTFGPGGSFLPIGTFGPTFPTAPNVEESVYGKQTINNWTFANNELLINPQAVALLGASDLRRKFYTNIPYPSGAIFPLGMLRRMGPTGLPYGVVLADIYLLRAECKARLNDLPGAKADVEALRVKRMPPADAPVPAATATVQLSLLKFILEERIREFAVQGFRWFDIRRLSVDPLFGATTYTHTLYSATGSITGTFTLKPERLIMRFPQKVIDQNPAMPNNP